MRESPRGWNVYILRSIWNDPTLTKPHRRRMTETGLWRQIARTHMAAVIAPKENPSEGQAPGRGGGSS